jgi:hypothetical protein
MTMMKNKNYYYEGLAAYKIREIKRDNLNNKNKNGKFS